MSKAQALPTAERSPCKPGAPVWNTLPDSLKARLPRHLWAELDAYVRAQQPPGSFVRHVLENEVYALSRCNPLHLLSLRAVVETLAYAPPECFGSPQSVAAWLEEVENNANANA